jgi:hypothetical protein
MKIVVDESRVRAETCLETNHQSLSNGFDLFGSSPLNEELIIESLELERFANVLE